VSHYARAMTWLVTGGAGYIGAHVVRAMVADGMDVVVLDDLSTGDPRRVPEAPLVVGSIRNRELVSDVLRDRHVDGVMHIAGKKQVGESVADPLLYYLGERRRDGRAAGMLPDQNVAHLVFSSSAAAYGLPDVERVTEQTPCQPLSPTGSRS